MLHDGYISLLKPLAKGLDIRLNTPIVEIQYTHTNTHTHTHTQTQTQTQTQAHTHTQHLLTPIVKDEHKTTTQQQTQTHTNSHTQTHTQTPTHTPQTRKRVRVITKSQEVFDADMVVVTLPLGVLKDRCVYVIIMLNVSPCLCLPISLCLCLPLSLSLSVSLCLSIFVSVCVNWCVFVFVVELLFCVHLLQLV